MAIDISRYGCEEIGWSSCLLADSGSGAVRVGVGGSLRTLPGALSGGPPYSSGSGKAKEE